MRWQTLGVSWTMQRQEKQGAYGCIHILRFCSHGMIRSLYAYLEDAQAELEVAGLGARLQRRVARGPWDGAL